MPSSLPQRRIAEERRRREAEAAAAQSVGAQDEYPSTILSPEENNSVSRPDPAIFASRPAGLAQAKDHLEETQSAAETARLNRQNQIIQSPEPVKPTIAPTVSTTVSEPRIINRGTSRKNPLFKYADYTYGLSLHVIPPEKYNKMVTEPGYQYKNNDSTVLIASGGRRDNIDFRRSSNFKEDFYFENLKFTTVIGMNSRSRNTNAIEASFTLIEPYGVTLLDRLLSVADSLKTKSWMQIPFLLQIDFLGNDDQGKLLTPIPNQTKYIPIKLIGCKIKVTSKGSEYQVSAIPFGHQAYTETNGVTPAFFEVQAKTLGDFFSSTGSAGEAGSIFTVRKLIKERQEAAIAEAELDEERGGGTRKAEILKESQSLTEAGNKMAYVVGSYAAALNSYQDQLKKHQHQYKKETYSFVFTDPAMNNSKIVVPKKTDARRTTMAKPNTPEGIAAIRSQAGLSTAGLDVNTETFTINAGTSIVEVINMVMRNSEYIRNQFDDPTTTATNGQEAADKAGRPINWYKIVPVVELDDFDVKLDRYSKRITYFIEPYIYYNTKFRDAPKALPTYYCKEYQYIYTGKNESIINFDIDFDTMFYTSITADRSKIQTTSVQNQDEENQTDSSKEKSKPVRIQNNVVQPVAGQADMVNPASPDSKGVLINDFSKSMMSNSRGDMITVNLKIIGDPELIKQDDIFYNPANNPNQKKDIAVDPISNSIIFDAGEVFALLKFKTPVDINDTTGLMKFQNFHTSVFSGVYKIITVENMFERGQFTQALQLVRMFDQPDYDTLEAPSIANQNSQENRMELAQDIADASSFEMPPGTDDDLSFTTTVTQVQSQVETTTRTAQETVKTSLKETTTTFITETGGTARTRLADLPNKVALRNLKVDMLNAPTVNLDGGTGELI